MSPLSLARWPQAEESKICTPGCRCIADLQSQQHYKLLMDSTTAVDKVNDSTSDRPTPVGTSISISNKTGAVEILQRNMLGYRGVWQLSSKQIRIL
ncbi:hypothetical protein ACU8KH_04629 [Lachancea thermotolerans]